MEAVAAAMVGGLLGVLIGFFALLILLDRFLDRVLDQTGLTSAEAEHAFLRLAHERRRAAIVRRLRHGSGDGLAYLADDAGWAAVAGRRPLGVVAIPVESVGEYYVRDGHHRVSVARALGIAAIDAEVVELVVRCSTASPTPRSMSRCSARCGASSPPGYATPGRAAEAIADLLDLPLRRYPHEDLVPRIWQLRESFSAYDATYLALAEVLTEEGAPLVTADGGLARAAAEHTAVEVILAA